ncbi:MAG TPA: F0F1 ATP synthase subunit B [Spirochaetia bacterium]|nr:F0F1 ATP synthase subunit B [Spirochaetia bacterium]
MESLGKLGLDPIHLAAQVVNFLIIGWIIWRFLLKPLLATMNARREKIAQGLADTEKAKMALENAAREREKILQEASAESFRILQAARDEAERLRSASLQKAGRDAERMIEEARGVIALERRDMEKAVQGLSLRLSGRILEKVVSDLFGEEERSRIVARGLERVGAEIAATGPSSETP